MPGAGRIARGDRASTAPAVPEGALSAGQEAGSGSPGQETFERGELAIHAAGLEPPMVHQEALVVPEIGRGDVCGGQLVPSRVPEPDGEGRQVTAVVLE